MVEKLTRLQVAVKMLRNEHEMREDSFVVNYRIDKNHGKYIDSVSGEARKFNKALRAINEYFEV